MATSRRSVLRAAVSTAALAVAGCVRGDGDPSSRPAPATPTSAPSTTARHSAPPAQASTAPLPPQVDHGPPDRRAVALTFHGAGDAGIARQVLAEAERARAGLTVLAVGTWLDDEPDLARRILDGGHDLGNHTQNHGPMSDMDTATTYAEITACAARLRQLTGSIGTWFRPSQLRDSTELIRTQAARAGYRTVLSYDLDSLDYTDPGPDAVTRTVLDAVGPGSVVSLHLGYEGTLRALPAILDGLHQRSLRAVTASQLLT